MKITILTYGSHGDVQPFLALAIGLQRNDHQVKLAAPHRFADFVSACNVPFAPLAGDPKIISQRLNDAGGNPLRMVRAMSDYIFSIADEVARQALVACNDAELIIHSFLFTTGGHLIARKLGIPDISMQTFPIFVHTRAFPPVSMPGLPPGFLSYFGHWLCTPKYSGKVERLDSHDYARPIPMFLTSTCTGLLLQITVVSRPRFCLLAVQRSFPALMICPCPTSTSPDISSSIPTILTGRLKPWLVSWQMANRQSA